MAHRKRISTDSMQTLLIVTANEAEATYLSQMRKDCRFSNLTVLSANTDSLEKLVNYAARERSRNKYDVVYALFGFDDVNATVDQVRSMDETCKSRRINLCYFNPTFELWFYLHLGKPQTFISDAYSIKKQVASAISADYEFTAEYLMTKGLNLHMQLFPKHALADLNARDYNEVARKATGFPASAIPELDAAITAICGTADMSHNTKVFK